MLAAAGDGDQAAATEQQQIAVGDAVACVGEWKQASWVGVLFMETFLKSVVRSPSSVVGCNGRGTTDY